jgi:hypothetical protein
MLRNPLVNLISEEEDDFKQCEIIHCIPSASSEEESLKHLSLISASHTQFPAVQLKKPLAINPKDLFPCSSDEDKTILQKPGIKLNSAHFCGQSISSETTSTAQFKSAPLQPPQSFRDISRNNDEFLVRSIDDALYECNELLLLDKERNLPAILHAREEVVDDDLQLAMALSASENSSLESPVLNLDWKTGKFTLPRGEEKQNALRNRMKEKYTLDTTPIKSVLIAKEEAQTQALDVLFQSTYEGNGRKLNSRALSPSSLCDSDPECGLWRQCSPRVSDLTSSNQQILSESAVGNADPLNSNRYSDSNTIQHLKHKFIEESPLLELLELKSIAFTGNLQHVQDKTAAIRAQLLLLWEQTLQWINEGSIIQLPLETIIPNPGATSPLSMKEREQTHVLQNVSYGNYQQKEGVEGLQNDNVRTCPISSKKRGVCYLINLS